MCMITRAAPVLSFSAAARVGPRRRTRSHPVQHRTRQLHRHQPAARAELQLMFGPRIQGHHRARPDLDLPPATTHHQSAHHRPGHQHELVERHRYRPHRIRTVGQHEDAQLGIAALGLPGPGSRHRPNAGPAGMDSRTARDAPGPRRRHECRAAPSYPAYPAASILLIEARLLGRLIRPGESDGGTATLPTG